MTFYLIKCLLKCINKKDSIKVRSLMISYIVFVLTHGIWNWYLEHPFCHKFFNIYTGNIGIQYAYRIRTKNVILSIKKIDFEKVVTWIIKGQMCQVRNFGQKVFLLTFCALKVRKCQKSNQPSILQYFDTEFQWKAIIMVNNE